MLVVAAAVAAAAPATAQIVGTQTPGERVFERIAGSVFLLQVEDSEGNAAATATGFLIGPGQILTNAHVARAGAINVQIGSVQIACALERSDQLNDLALCRMAARTSAVPVPLASHDPNIGASVFAIGNPRGLSRTITEGLFSGPRDMDGRQVSQISAAISPGSSGGPVLNASGELIGVAVSFLADGQNLNFAVPLTIIRRFIANDAPKPDPAALLSRARALQTERDSLSYSDDPNSEWRKTDRLVETLLAETVASTSDPEILTGVFSEAELWHPDVAVSAARKAVATAWRPGHVEYERLARALFASAEESAPSSELDEAEDAARRAVELAKSPTVADLQLLSEIELKARRFHTAYANLSRAAALLKADDAEAANIFMDLFNVCRELGDNVEAEKWFVRARSAGATAEDWQQFAAFLESLSRYTDAADAYAELFKQQPDYSLMCSAGTDYFLGGSGDAALDAARRCIEMGATRKGSERAIEEAHKIIAGILNARGVYTEASAHAKEAVAIDATDPWAYYYLAKALGGQRRFTEAVSASTHAVRLSDGKYFSMHFELGSALFELERWPEASQAFAKAAELEPANAAAAYNTAVSLYNDDRYDEALRWYREALRRNPRADDREQVVRMIERLSGR